VTDIEQSLESSREAQRKEQEARESKRLEREALRELKRLERESKIARKSDATSSSSAHAAAAAPSEAAADLSASANNQDVEQDQISHFEHLSFLQLKPSASDSCFLAKPVKPKNSEFSLKNASAEDLEVLGSQMRASGSQLLILALCMFWILVKPMS
jgi:hypothetical protein